MSPKIYLQHDSTTTRIDLSPSFSSSSATLLTTEHEVHRLTFTERQTERYDDSTGRQMECAFAVVILVASRRTKTAAVE